jgi:hypothetical protein
MVRRDARDPATRRDDDLVAVPVRVPAWRHDDPEPPTSRRPVDWTLVPAVGERIRVTALVAGDPNPMAVGSTGTVTRVNEDRENDFVQVQVDWDSGRSLALVDDDLRCIVREG